MVSLLIDFHDARRQIQPSVVVSLAQIAGPVHVNHGKEVQNLVVVLLKLRYNSDTIKFTV